MFVVDCIWELFVLVGRDARSKRLDIRLALSVAEALAKKASSSRPFTPTIHALVFPSKIPADLLLTFRELEESAFVGTLWLCMLRSPLTCHMQNAGDVPDHMNLIPASEADLKVCSFVLLAFHVIRILSLLLIA